ncbi:protein-L-isoaspartate(D-aspartate) O-methyltransferase [Achromobacter sp.]|uniref:protein-L-isoaspartate(D-aspartate) O-methyltransferase n=1 Tax=Achromobacter sp. TaxID=134375 RepID=UPI003D023F49
MNVAQGPPFPAADMDEEQELRENMVQRQLVARGVRDPAVLGAMRRVPRSAFVPDESRALAYDDRALPIGCGQTISQPYIVALMAQAASMRPGDRVLEIGAGSGYAAAVMAQIVGKVDAIERHERLAIRARETLRSIGCGNVAIHVGDGTLGLPEKAPFDVIVAAAAGPIVPPSWREQLAVGGRLVMPLGDRPAVQRLVRITRRGIAEYEQLDLGMVAFVPLIGAQGWQDDEDDDQAHGG